VGGRRGEEHHQASRAGEGNSASAGAQPLGQGDASRAANPPRDSPASGRVSQHRRNRRGRPGTPTAWAEGTKHPNRRGRQAGAKNRRVRAGTAPDHQRTPGTHQGARNPPNQGQAGRRQRARARHRHDTGSHAYHDTRHSEARAAEQRTPAGKATLTDHAGTGSPHAEKTGEPTEPRRTHTRQPSAEATKPANAEANPTDANGTNRQAGAGDQPAPAGSARRAHTQRPPATARATTPAPRREPGTETKPEAPMTRTPEGAPRRRRGHEARSTRKRTQGAPRRRGEGAALHQSEGSARPPQGQEPLTTSAKDGGQEPP
jgi:hypothetical protein